MATVQNRRDYYADVPANDLTTNSTADVYPARMMTTRLQRVSWGAIFAGIVVALVTMLALNMLGLSIGAATINPAVEANPVEPGMATGTIIWLIASNLISLFLGGYVAGYLSRSIDHTDGVMHGVVTWGAVTLITFALLTTSIGGVVNGVVSAASRALAATGAAAAPAVANALDNQPNVLSAIGTEIQTMMQPVNGTSDTTIPGATGNTANTGTAVGLDQFEINRAVTSLFTKSEITDADRQEVATLIAERTGVTPAEASERLARWETVYTQVATEAEETARTAAQTAADALTLLAGAMFAALLAGAFAGGVGGLVGTPEPTRDTRTVVTNTAA